MILKRSLYKLGGLAVAATLVALGGAAGVSGATKAGPTLVVAVVGTPPTLDTEYFTGTPQSWEVADNIYDNLHYYKTNLANGTRAFNNPQVFEPRLAQKITSNKGGNIWTVYLRHGVKNNLGDEMTADDWIWSFKRSFALKGVGSFIAAQMGIPNAAAIKKLDKYTLQFHMKQFTSLPPNLWTLNYPPIVDSKEIMKHATKSDPWARNWMATNGSGYGPYYVDSFQAGSQVVLKANPNYYRGVPQIGTIIYKAVPEASNRLALIQSGAVDVALQLSAPELTQVKNSHNANLEIYDPGTAGSNNEIVLTMNTNYAPFKNPLVRQALMWAVPYKQVLNDVFQGWAEPLKSWIPPQYPGYTDKYFPFTTNPAKAKALLKQSGVPLPLSVTAVYGTAHPENEAVMVAVKTAFANVGVNLTLKPVTAAQFASLTFNRSPQMLLGASLQAHPIDSVFALSQFAACDKAIGFLNWGNYCDQSVEKLFKASAVEPVAAKRYHDVELMQKEFEKNPPWLVLGRFPFAVVHTKNVTGWDWAPDDGLKFFELKKT